MSDDSIEDAKLDPEHLHGMIVRLGEGLVREGRLPLPQLSDSELDQRFNDGIRGMFRDEQFDVALTFDHTNKLLHQAAFYENEHDLEVCSLFYMLWIEHRVNLIARVMLRRGSMPDEQAVALIRKLSIREKLTVLWRLLGLVPVGDETIKLISTIEEFRNAFVHFKWPSFPDLYTEDRTWQSVNRVQEIIDTLWNTKNSMCTTDSATGSQNQRLG